RKPRKRAASACPSCCVGWICDRPADRPTHDAGPAAAVVSAPHGRRGGGVPRGPHDRDARGADGARGGGMKREPKYRPETWEQTNPGYERSKPTQGYING